MRFKRANLFLPDGLGQCAYQIPPPPPPPRGKASSHPNILLILTLPEAADSSGVQEFDLSADELQGRVLPLRLVKFNRVHCLTLFIQSNQEDEDCTILQKIAFLGTAGDTMNVAQIKDISKDQE